MYYRWSKDFLEAGKKRLAGDTVREATSDEVKELRAECRDRKEVCLAKTRSSTTPGSSICTASKAPLHEERRRRPVAALPSYAPPMAGHGKKKKRPSIIRVAPRPRDPTPPPQPEPPRPDLIPEPTLVRPAHPIMKALGKQVVQLRAAKERTYLERCLALGMLLRQARTRLGHGDWLPWLRKQARLSRMAAGNYIALSTWAEHNPRDLERWRALGATKLILVARAGRAVRAKLRRKNTKQLQRTSTSEFRMLLLRLAPSKSEPPSTARQLAALERRARRVLRDVHQLLERTDRDDLAVAKIRGVLLEAAEALHGDSARIA